MEPAKPGIVVCMLILIFCAGCVEDPHPISPDTTTSIATIATSGIPSRQVQEPALTPSAIPVKDTNITTVATTTATGSFIPLKLRQSFLFGNNTTWGSEVTLTRIWINDTYHWYNPEELQYDTRIAPEGKKYLFIFLSMVNRGTERAPLPPQANIYVLCDNSVISHYASHPLPMKNPDSTPRIVRIAEIEYSHKVYSSELVEDYGYSHGQRLAYITPGESNAVEGYIIYEVPASMIPETTYVKAILPDKSEATWVLG